ncbi:MAG TPA: hypothetical protein VEF89_01265 [Solirubrobacteraceae bacterium]|nr:hypothetical protein [Solirubrobacteraceae bacterium]
MLVGGIAVRRLSGRVSGTQLILAGSALLTAGYLLAFGMAFPPILAAAGLAGFGQSAHHSTLQQWATDAAPDARGLRTALFATGAFGGAALAALAGVLLPEHFRALFIAGAASACAAGVLAVTRHAAA